MKILFMSILISSSIAHAVVRGGSDVGSAGEGALLMPACNPLETDIIKHLVIEDEIETAISSLREISIKSNNTEQIQFLRIQTGILQANYLKCDAIIGHQLRVQAGE